MVVTSLFLLLSLVSHDPGDLAPGTGTDTANWIGPVGASIARTFLGGVGVVAFPLVLTLGIAGLQLMRGRGIGLTGAGVAAFLAALVAASVLVHVGSGGGKAFGQPGGGLIGLYVGEVSRALVSSTGSVLVFGSVLLVAIATLTRRPLRVLFGPLFLRLIAALGALPRTIPWPGVLRRVGRLVGIGRGADAAAADPGGDTAGGAAGESGTDTPEGAADAPRRGWRRRAPVIDHGPAPEGSAGDGGAAPEGAPEPGAPAAGTSSRVAPDADADGDAGGEAAPAGAAAAVPASPTAAPATPTAPRAAIPSAPSKGGPRIIESDAMKNPTQLDLIPQGRRVVRPPLPTEYELPDLALLDYEPPRERDIDEDYLRENARRLEEKLADFKVDGEVVEIHPGPVVTTYEFKPAAGVKISRIQNLSDDLTMALAAQRVRIIAPIPGKAVVGIEVPNRHREIVYLREVFASKAFLEAKHKLTLALGKDIVGHPTAANLAKMPHLLVAGATGSGKSVAINAFILSVLFRASPDEVKMIMVDPKMLELTVYQGIPHLLLPVVTDPKEAAVALKWAVCEMERRYRLMSRFGVRNIVGFNKRVEELKKEYEENQAELKRILALEAAGEAARSAADDGAADDEDDGEGAALDGGTLWGGGSTDEEEEGPPEPFPYIVVIVDELADLMMVASKDVETSIARLAQMARACGIHLILATQRPSVDVITGLIKANFPTRLSFQVASKIDSRTILDQKGAEALLGMGDMLFMPPGTSALERNHGAFVSDEEVRRVVEFVKAQRRPEYQMDILKSADDGGQADVEEEPYDEHYDAAVAIVAESRQASISYLQRRLKIGYNRAARIVERMEREGLVGPADGAKPRDVFIDPI
jgi:S-DNA-T family DNA segregation ATPase FtsK/SpoIIIE